MSYGIAWRDGVAEIRLACGKGNALNPTSLAAIAAAFEEAGRSGARGVVLTGYERFFSTGLDLVTLYGGELYPPEAARARGLVDALADGDLLADAAARRRRLAEGSAGAFETIKASLRAPALSRAEASLDALRRAFVDAWFSPEARERIGAVRARLLG